MLTPSGSWEQGEGCRVPAGRQLGRFSKEALRLSPRRPYALWGPTDMLVTLEANSTGCGIRRADSHVQIGPRLIVSET